MSTDEHEAASRKPRLSLTRAQTVALREALIRHDKPLTPEDKARVEEATVFERDRKQVLQRRWRQK